MPKKRKITHKSRRQRRTRRKLRGGEELGSGGFGCVFTPSLACGNSSNNRANTFKGKSFPNYVTKLTDSTTASEEREKGDQLRIALETTALAPNNILIGPSAICGLPALTDAQKAELLTCTQKLPKPQLVQNNPYLVQLKNGGISLDKFVCPVEDRGAFMASLYDLFDGLRILHSRNIAHLDIKPNNIVTMRKPDGTYLTRFIDIGFMLSIDKYDEADLGLSIYRNNYVIWPFEARYLAEPIIDPLPSEVADFYNGPVTDLPKFGVPDLQYFVDKNPAKGRIFDHPDFLPNYLKVFRDAAGERKIGVIAKGVDVYSLGYTLCIVYRKVFGHVYMNGKIAIPGQDEFNVRLFAEVTNPIMILIGKMMTPFPDYRFSMEQVTQEYNRILGKLNTVLGI